MSSSRPIIMVPTGPDGGQRPCWVTPLGTERFFRLWRNAAIAVVATVIYATLMGWL